MENYKYELKYYDENKTVINIFRGEVNIYELKDNLVCFLLNCGWDADAIYKIFKGENDE